MRLLQNRLHSGTNAVAGNGASSSLAHRFALSRRSGLEIAGVFILLAVLAVIGAYSNHKVPIKSRNSSQKAPVSLQVSQQAASTPPSNTSLTQSSSTNSAASGVSSHVTSNSSGGSTSTSMTVNGQPISIPANGSTRQTITSPGGGTVSVSASQTQDGSGSSMSTSVTSTDINVNSSTDSNVSVSSGGD